MHQQRLINFYIELASAEIGSLNVNRMKRQCGFKALLLSFDT